MKLYEDGEFDGYGLNYKEDLEKYNITHDIKKINYLIIVKSIDSLGESTIGITLK